MLHVKAMCSPASFPIHQLKLEVHENKLFDSLETIKLNQFLVNFGHVP